MGTSHAALLTYDGFEDYTVGTGLSGGSQGTGWTSNWTADVAATTQTKSLVDGNGLVDGGVKALRMMPTTNQSDLGNFMSRNFASQSGDLYISFLIRHENGIGNDDFYNFQVTNGLTGNTAAAMGVGIRNAGGSPFFARVGSSSSGQTTNATTNAAINTTYLLVAKFSKDGSANYNRVDLFINPSSTAEPGMASATATSNVTGLTSLSTFTVRNFQPEANDTLFFDELRIGTSFADVLPVPEPSSAMLLLFSATAFVFRRRR